MSNLKTLIDRNTKFANDFDASELKPIPKLRTVVLTCADARVDPAHIFKLELGESLVIRNTGGRVTQEVIEEIGSMAFMVAKMEAPVLETFEVVIMQHTQCGAERFADLNFQKALLEQVGIDVSSIAIINHEKSLAEDIERLRNAPEIPGHIIVSGCIYDVKDGSVRKVIKPNALGA